MANGGTSLLTASTLGEASPETARRTWPRWLLLGLAMIAVAVVAVVWSASGARLLLGALGLFLAVRGLVLVRGAQTPEVTTELAARARSVGGATAVVGVAGLLVAVLSGGLASAVLLVAVPLGLLGGAAALLGRDDVGRRAGQALLVWALLVTGLLIVAGVGQGWGRAGEVATVVGALAVAVLGVPVLLGAARLRVVAATPVAAAPGAGCGGCACGAGGCAALG